MQRLFLLLLIFICHLSVAQQSTEGNQDFIVMSYNVENLFDTIDDPKTIDEEFLQAGKKKWTSGRYKVKLDQLSKVIVAPYEENLPAVIGLYEIENKKVVQDLSATELLKKGKYNVVQFDSPDLRGIDVAMMYREDRFIVLFSKPMFVKLPADTADPTRDILYVKGIADKTDTLHFFLNHWPSRRDGAEVTEMNRMAAATVLRHSVDSLFNVSKDNKIIIIGDFNDYPINKSISETLGADSILSEPPAKDLFNLCYDLEKTGQGTYNYRNDWGMLDQIIVSNGVLNDNSLHVSRNGVRILKEKWMLYFAEGRTDGKPNATYGGNKYFGGYSDHLPVYMSLTRK